MSYWKKCFGFWYWTPKAPKVKTYDLGGTVSFDDDKDGTQFNSVRNDNHRWLDKGVAGIKVTLYNDDGEVVDTTYTDHKGRYEFTVTGGDYHLLFEKPDGTRFADKDTGRWMVDSDVDADGLTDVIHVRGHNRHVDVSVQEADTPDQNDACQLGTADADSMTGTDAAECFDGLDGNDTIRAGDGDDTLSGSEGRDRLQGQNGNDLLMGGANADKLYGELGDDTLDGGDGNDILNGGHGQDMITGGSGADLFVFDATRATRGGEDDTITDFEAGIDTIRFDYAAGVDIDVQQSGDDVEVFFDGELGLTVLDAALADVIAATEPFDGSLYA